MTKQNKNTPVAKVFSVGDTITVDELQCLPLGSVLRRKKDLYWLQRGPDGLYVSILEPNTWQFLYSLKARRIKTLVIEYIPTYTWLRKDTK